MNDFIEGSNFRSVEIFNCTKCKHLSSYYSFYNRECSSTGYNFSLNLNNPATTLCDNFEELSACYLCKIETYDLYSHHIIPVSMGGKESKYAGSNLIDICGICHGILHNRGDMSYLTAFEKKHDMSFLEAIKDLDNRYSEADIMDMLKINRALLTTLRRKSGLPCESDGYKKKINCNGTYHWEDKS